MSKDINTAAFGKDWEPRLGQKIVALTDSESWEKDDVFEVLAVRKACKHIEVDIGIKAPISGSIRCDFCGHLSDVVEGGIWWASVKCFAPLQHFPDATAEILSLYPLTERIETDIEIKEHCK